MRNKHDKYPFLALEELLAENLCWLLEAVDTKEASRMLCIPEPTLISWRSRPGSNTPRYFNPLGTRMVRYLRLELMRWLVSGGYMQHTFDDGHTINLPLAANDNEEDA